MNPLLPLLKSQIVCRTLTFFFCGVLGLRTSSDILLVQISSSELELEIKSKRVARLMFLEPMIDLSPKESFLRLVDLEKGSVKKGRLGETVFFVSPETVVSFPINCFEELVGLTGQNHKIGFILGGGWETDKNYQQVVYMLEGGLIKSSYVKSKLCPLFEHNPIYAKKIRLQFSLTSKTKNPPINSSSITNASEDKAFGLFVFEGAAISFRPLVCFEFFFYSLPQTKADFYIIFVNDSLFLKYFANLLFLHSRERSLFSKKPILYSSNVKKLRTTAFFDNLNQQSKIENIIKN